MKKSESIKEITMALVEAGKCINNVKDSAINPFYNSRYAPLPEILRAVKPILCANDLSIVQSSNHIEFIGKPHVEVETLLSHKSGEWIISSLTLPSFVMNTKGMRYDPQTVGAALSFGRRYTLNASLNISSDKDDDCNMMVSSPEVKPVIKYDTIDIKAITDKLRTADREKTDILSSEIIGKTFLPAIEEKLTELFAFKYESLDKREKKNV